MVFSFLNKLYWEIFSSCYIIIIKNFQAVLYQQKFIINNYVKRKSKMSRIQIKDNIFQDKKKRWRFFLFRSSEFAKVEPNNFLLQNLLKKQFLANARNFIHKSQLDLRFLSNPCVPTHEMKKTRIFGFRQLLGPKKLSAAKVFSF